MVYKTHVIRLILLCVCISAGIHLGYAQGNPLLGKFSVSQYDGRVSLFWQIVEGSTCNGIQIYRSTDSIDFQRIGYIAGICGSLTEPVNYNFTDELPIENTINYYYLELGTVGTSDIISIDVFPATGGSYVIRPHPIVDQATIFFDAVGNDVNALRVYDFGGQEVYRSDTPNVFFEINTASLPSGLYPFTITSSGNNLHIKGTFLVQH